MQKTGSAVIAQRLLRDSFELSRDGVRTMRRVVSSAQMDRELILRFGTPFAVLFLWLITGMLIFYAVESPAETARHRALLAAKNAAKAAQQQLLMSDELVGYGARFGPSVEEQTIVLDMSPAPGSSGNDSSTRVVELNANAIRQFNRKFYYAFKDLDVVAVKISRPAPTIGQYLTLTVFYSNKTKLLARCNDSSMDFQEAENFKWDLPGSLFFCLAVVTTIGYGDLAPTTPLGKFLCVIYAMIGVPLCLVVVGIMRRLLIRYASRLHQFLYGLAQRFERHSVTLIERGSQLYPRLNQQQRRIVSPMTRTASQDAVIRAEIQRTEVRAATGVAFICCCLMFIFLPSIFFTWAEDWDYLSALYYSFISLTTIGFGDFIAGQKSGGEFSYGLYRVFLCIWLFLGIAFVATLIHVMETLVERVIERLHYYHRKSATAKSASARNSNNNGGGGVSSVQEEATPPTANSVNLLDIIDSNLLCDSKAKSSNETGSLNEMKRNSIAIIPEKEEGV